MMKSLLKTLLVLCMAVSLMMLTGCGDDKKEVAEEQPATLIGAWTLTDMVGSDDAVQSMKYYEEMGLKVTMAISNDQIEMVTTDGDHSEYGVSDYRVEGTQIITGTSTMDYVLEGKTLKLTTGGVTMVFTQK